MASGDIITTIPGGQLGTVATPVTTGTNGTITSGTTETRDAVLGNYVFTVPAAQATWRYRAVYSGVGLLGSVANDRFAVNIRDGGGSTPTSASTLWGHNDTKVIGVTGSNGVETMVCTPTFVPGSGTHTLSVFTVRLVGTGTATPVGSREFYVECLGPN